MAVQTNNQRLCPHPTVLQGASLVRFSAKGVPTFLPFCCTRNGKWKAKKTGTFKNNTLVQPSNHLIFCFDNEVGIVNRNVRYIEAQS